MEAGASLAPVLLDVAQAHLLSAWGGCHFLPWRLLVRWPGAPIEESDRNNGYVAWNDEQLFSRVGALIADPHSARRLCGADLAVEWNWERLAPYWNQAILGAI